MENTENILDIFFKESKNLNDYEFLEKEIEENFQITYKKYIFLEDDIFDDYDPENINMRLNYVLYLDDTVKLERILKRYDFVQKYNISYTDESEKENDFVEIKISKLNNILDQTANIVLIKNNLESFKKYLSLEKQDEFEEVIDQISKYRENINKIIINSRVVDLKEEVRKIESIIIDYSKILNKEIQFKVKGLKINIDKYIFNKIKDHIINVFVNSILYGIESGEERQLYEKDKRGLLTLLFKQEFGEIVVEMIDDGQGIDVEEIYQRAEKSGLIDKNKTYTKEEILNTIFKPEISLTNKKDENIERDLTLSNFYNTVDELGGSIKAESEKNKYTVITVRIPLSFILTESLLVKAGDINYAFPFSSVEKTIKIEKKNFSYVSDYMYYSLDNVDYPVLKIPDELLGNKQKMLNYGIILSISSEKYIFLVDYIGEIEELVPRKINIDNKLYNSFLGAAILKNEEIVLILDVKKISENNKFLMR